MDHPSKLPLNTRLVDAMPRGLADGITTAAGYLLTPAAAARRERGANPRDVLTIGDVVNSSEPELTRLRPFLGFDSFAEAIRSLGYEIPPLPREVRKYQPGTPLLRAFPLASGHLFAAIRVATWVVEEEHPGDLTRVATVGDVLRHSELFTEPFVKHDDAGKPYSDGRDVGPAAVKAMREAMTSIGFPLPGATLYGGTPRAAESEETPVDAFGPFVRRLRELVVEGDEEGVRKLIDEGPQGTPDARPLSDAPRDIGGIDL